MKLPGGQKKGRKNDKGEAVSLSFFSPDPLLFQCYSRCTFVLAERKISSPDNLKPEENQAGFCEAALIGAGARNMRPDLFTWETKIIFFRVPCHSPGAVVFLDRNNKDF